MNTELNIVARRIFNRLDVDISDRRGLGNEWDQISPNVKNVDIRRTWEQIITEEIEKHTAALQTRVDQLDKLGSRLNLLLCCEAGYCDTEEWSNSMREERERMIETASVEWEEATGKGRK